MGDFKNEYKRAMDSLEPDRRLLESLKTDMKAAKEVPPGNFPAPLKPNFFVKYGWVFGSAAACIAVVLAVSVFFALGRSELSGGSSMMDGAANNAAPEMIENAADKANNGADQDFYGANGGAEADVDGAELEPSGGSYVVTTSTTVSQPDGLDNDAADDVTGNAVITTTTTRASQEAADDRYQSANGDTSLNDSPPFSINDMPFTDGEISDSDPITDRQLKEWTALAEQGRLTYGDLEKCSHTTKLYKGLYTMGCMYLDEGTGQSYVLISCYFVQSADSAPAYVVLREVDSGETLDLLHEYDMLDRFLAQ